MEIYLHNGFLINIGYCIPLSFFFFLLFEISLNIVMIRGNLHRISLNKNIEEKKICNLIFRFQADRIPSQLFSPPTKHLDFQLAPEKNG